MVLAQNCFTSYTRILIICLNGQSYKKLVWRFVKSQFSQKFMQNYDDDNKKGYILESEVRCPNQLQNVYSDCVTTWRNEDSEIHEK